MNASSTVSLPSWCFGGCQRVLLAWHVLSGACQPRDGRPGGSAWSAGICLAGSLIVGGPLNALAQMTPPEARGPRIQNAAGSIGVGRFRAGEWGAAELSVVNPTDEPLELQGGIYFTNDPNLQFTRRLWVPPRSRRRVWYPVRPPLESPSESYWEYNSVLFDVTQGEPRLLRNEDGSMFESGLLPRESNPVVAGAITDRDDNDARNAMVAFLVSRQVPRRLSGFHQAFQPPAGQLLESLRYLLISSDRFRDDSGFCEALRQWLHSGGTVWVMLDQVEEESVRRLIGDSFDTQIVDRVTIVDVQIEGAQGQVTPGDPQPREFVRPIDLVRVIPGSVEVQYAVDGWPAAFTQRVGSGRVLYTTLDAKAWIRGRTADDPPQNDALLVSNFLPRLPLEMLAASLIEKDPQVPLDVDEFGPYLNEQIGYAIPTRNSILVVLGGYCLVLLAGGIWFLKQQRLERLGLLALLASVLTAGIFVYQGLAARRAVPSTLAVAEFIEVNPGDRGFHVNGLMASFHPEQTSQPVGAQAPTFFIPDMTGLEGELRQLVVHDVNDWSWTELTLPAGVRTAAFRYGGAMSAPIRAVAEFGESGVMGTLEKGDLTGWSDVLIASARNGAMGVTLQDDGSFSADADQTLPPGQYISSTLVDDEQRRRQDIYGKLFEQVRSADQAYPTRPTLFAWTDGIDAGIQFPETERQVRYGLVALPLDFVKTPPGRTITVPSPLLTFSAVTGPGLEHVSTMYNSQWGEWTETRNPMRGYVRFAIPPSVLPASFDRAWVRLDILASFRKVRILGVSANNEAIEAATLNGPVGDVEVRIDDAAALQVDPGGGLVLGIDVGEYEGPDAEQGEDAPLWQIQSLQLQLHGETE